MYYIKELCIKLVTYQKLYRDARSGKYYKVFIGLVGFLVFYLLLLG